MLDMNFAQRAAHYAKTSKARKQNREELKRFTGTQPEIAEVVGRVRTENLTFLNPAALIGLAEAALEIEASGLDGEFIEAGAALGGSAIVLGKSKSPARSLRLYDTFGLIPPPSDKDGEDIHERYDVIVSGKSEGIGGSVYYGYRDDLIGEVSASFKRFGVPPEENNVSFVQGVYQDSMSIDFPIALAHVDCDWYESVMTCLERIEPWLVPGGRFIIDDYDAWSGARTAVDEFFADRSGYTFGKRSRLHIIKDR